MNLTCKVPVVMFGFFRVLMTPACWLQNYKYSPAWEMELEVLLVNYKFKRIDNATAMLGPYEIWYENHPYASFRPWKWVSKHEYRPKRITMLRAMDKLKEDLKYEQYLKTC